MLPSKSIYIWFAVAVLGLSGCSSTQEAAQEKSPKHIDPPQMDPQLLLTRMFMDGHKQKTQGNYEEALTIYRETVQLDPACAACHYEIANILETQENLAEALINANKAVELNPEETWYLAFRAFLLRKTGEFDRAVADYKKLISKQPQKGKHYLELAYTQEEAGQLKAALNTYNELEKVKGIQEKISLKRHEIAVKLKDYTAAETALQDLITKVPGDLRYYKLLTDFYVATKQQDKARKLLDKTGSLFPENTLIQFSLAQLLYEEGKVVEAFSALNKACSSPDITAEEKIGTLIGFLAPLEDRAPHLATSIDICNKIQQAHPDEPAVYALKGDLYLQAEQIEPARDAYRDAIQRNGSRFEIWQELLLLDEYLRDYKGMVADSEKALEFFPTQARFYLHQGRAYNLLDQKDPANESLDMGSSVLVENPELSLMFELERLHSKLLDKENIETELQKLAQENSESGAEILEKLGDLFALTNQVDKAKSHWEKAQKKGGRTLLLKRKLAHGKI